MCARRWFAALQNEVKSEFKGDLASGIQHAEDQAKHAADQALADSQQVYLFRA